MIVLLCVAVSRRKGSGLSSVLKSIGKKTKMSTLVSIHMGYVCVKIFLFVSVEPCL